MIFSENVLLILKLVVNQRHIKENSIRSNKAKNFQNCIQHFERSMYKKTWFLVYSRRKNRAIINSTFFKIKIFIFTIKI